MDNKQTIQNLISKGDVDGALKVLATFSDEATLLMSRWNGLKREKMLGMISFSDEQMNRNRIVQAILSCAGVDGSSVAMNTSSALVQSSSGWESDLLQIIKDNERKNATVAKEALKYLEAFRSYHDTKKTRAFFDVSGRKLQELQQELDDFKATLNNQNLDSKESFIERVSDLLSAKIPDWPSIQEAFTLCVGRGFASSWLKQTLELQPSDDEAKLNAVQMIEGFLSRV